MSTLPYLVVFALIFVFFVFPAYLSFRREERLAREELARSRAASRHEPASIRPHVDPARCIGCGTCVTACPEGKILQIIDGHAVIVNGAACVGHGACAEACPVDAIELVFGSARRGIDIPAVGPDFQTNVPGLYVAGELGGMGLIANAVEQGIQALSNLARQLPPRPEDGLDVIIVGAGPAGLAAGLEARRRGLQCLVVEQGQFGGAIRHFPRQKVVMTRGFTLPGRSGVSAGTMVKEQLVEVFSEAVRSGGVALAEQERVESVTRRADGAFEVRTTKQALVSSRVLLAVGRRGTPRTLDVPGEDLEKVAYRLLDPEQYHHAHLLVVGGGDSAVEAACALAAQQDNRVTLAYRGEGMHRPKTANQQALARAVEAGRIDLRLATTVREIGLDRVWLEHQGEEAVLANDFVFVFAGGLLPTRFLQQAGVTVQRHFGDRVEALGAEER